MTSLIDFDIVIGLVVPQRSRLSLNNYFWKSKKRNYFNLMCVCRYILCCCVAGAKMFLVTDFVALIFPLFFYSFAHVSKYDSCGNNK